ncbi:hypothetical protein L1887_52112 [Cichorium endivia]|nr:hypothetical protein L1887_52112 [Cichorium endivia]
MPADDSHAATTAAHDDGQPAKRKRLRIPKSCIPCLKGKRACDRGRPACGRCARSGQSSDCTYDPRLPHQPASASSKRSASCNDSDDEDDDEAASPAAAKQLAALRAELQEARSETRRLQHLLRYPSAAPAPASPRPASSSWSTGSPLGERHRTLPSASTDMHAARGLQMLAEIAGPQHQDADTNATKSRILHWSAPASQASQAASSSSSASSSHRSPAFHSAPAQPPRSPASRYLGSTRQPAPQSPYAKQAQAGQPPRTPRTDDLDSPTNINGTQIYYGESGDVLRTVVANSTSAMRTGGQPATGLHESKARADMRFAFNSVLDPSRDTFPFATIWSSGTAFIDEVLPFFPRAEDFDTICASFVRHFSAMCPALTIPTAINHAKSFSRMTRTQQAQVSLPWLGVFLMICALGKNCDLESTTVGVDRKVRMLGAFLAGEPQTLSRQASRQASRASSPAPHAEAATAAETSAAAAAVGEAAAQGPAMVSDLFLSAAYQSLRLCSFLSAPTLQTIHCQLLIGSYLLNTERAASFWPLLGSVARQAQSIGLHVDPYKIRRDWDAVEADTRRRLWWAAVHQDAILSSIFGRPLGITRFSCRFPAPPAPGTVTYARLQCEFSQFARTYLDENQENSWSQAQVIEYTERVLQWYMNIPERYRPDLGRIDLLGSEGDAEAIQNYRAAGVDLKTKGLMEVHQSGNLAVEVFYVLMSLHRSNLYSHEEKEEGRREINETSLHICAQALRRITRAQQTMIDLLGRARATMFWKIAYYTYQAAIAGAYIVFVRPQSKHAQSALEDLAVLVDFFDRMPERWTGLKMAKHGLRVLRKLAVAARETPEAASMAVRTPQPEVEPQAPVQEPEPSADISPSALFPSASGVEFSSHSGFLPPIFTTALPTEATASPSGLANVPLVTLFNNTYDQQGATPPTRQFCYDPFIPDPAPLDSAQNTEVATPPTASDTAPAGAPLNPKDLANYWSEYFSLQLDWDRLTGLA